MFRKSEVNRAVCLALATSAGLASAPVMAEFEEIVVTATKRATDLQDTPIAIQALGEEKLDELNIANFDDYIRYLPNVNSAGRGPGQSSVFIRGMATDSSDQTSVEIGAPVPNVALYLDEQPVSSGGRNLDLYTADIARVEVLPGPQGTLFGASSQAGTVRLITNKPVYNEFQAGFDASYSTTSGGDDSNSVEAFVNIPVIDDKFAIRAVFYSAVEGGYIDNVFGENAYEPTDVGYPAGSPNTVVNNIAFVEDDFNDAVYRGARVSAKIALSDDWEVIPQFMTQALDVDGVFDHSPPSIADLDPESAGSRVVGDLKVQRFFPDFLDDEFNQFSLTVNGRLGALDLVYAGSFLDREVNNSFDYSGYTQVGDFGAYYICDYANYAAYGFYGTCGDPTQGMIANIENERTTHEFRLSYDEGEMFAFVAGVFLDDIEAKVDTNFYVAGSVGAFAPNTPHSQSTVFNPNPRAEGITFMNDAIRDEEQIAFFGEVTFNVTDSLALTVGARNYDIETSLVGSSNFATLCPAAPAPCTAADDGDGGVSYDVEFANDLPLKEDDTIFKGSVSFAPNDDLLFFGTYSEGFRPGGFNRSDNPLVPKTYVSDEVTNLEFGWKTTMANGTVRFNGSIYQIDWDNVQIGVTDFNIGVLTFVLNAADAEIQGFEGDLTWLPNDNLTLAAVWSYNSTEMVKVPPNISNLAPEGSDLALAPEFQYNLSARYHWEVGDKNAHAQLVLAHTDEQFSSIVTANRFEQGSYDTLDGAIGVSADNWGIELFAENLTDERAELFINSLDTDLRITTNRPRTWGVRVSYDF
ncbi:MAG: TonB-dependent receptor [Gammaproteobacteria bacterium]|nr:TonB-dependent receptor [Gammaproteobacteria bacterium]MDH3751417.1 TonB-dependent receptor [Gammaproteobacteria bacterium]